MIFGSSVTIKLQNIQFSTLLLAIPVSNNGIQNNFLSTQNTILEPKKNKLYIVIIECWFKVWSRAMAFEFCEPQIPGIDSIETL